MLYLHNNYPSLYENIAILYKHLSFILKEVIYKSETIKDINTSRRIDIKKEIKLSYNQLICVSL